MEPRSHGPLTADTCPADYSRRRQFRVGAAFPPDAPSQSGPVDLLTTVSATVNNTDEVWLVAMSDAGNNVNVEGTALSSNAVANLMTNLMKTGYFKTVEIKEAYQDEAEKKLQAFNFSLICEKLPPNAAGKKS